MSTGPEPMNTPNLIDARFGMIAVKKGFVTREQVRLAVLAQKQAFQKQNKSVLIGDILVQSGAITLQQKNSILSIQKANKSGPPVTGKKPDTAPSKVNDSFVERRFGMIAVKKGFATREQVKQAIYIQKMASKKNIPTLLSDILVKTGIMTQDQKDEILMVKGVNFTAIDKQAVPEPHDVLPEPQERVPQFVLTVSDDKLEVRLGPKDDLPLVADLDDIKQALEENNIHYGVVADDLLAERLGEAVDGGKSVIIAQGEKPVESRDAGIKYHFNAGFGEPSDKEEPSTGQGERVLIKQGDIVAEKIPGLAGKPGIDVYGQSIETSPPAEVSLQCGDGVLLSGDGQTATAIVEGYSEISSAGDISVYPLLKIAGDANRENGDIEFDGHIEIEGSIEGKIKIKGRSLKAREVYESTIDITGDMEVEKGISDARVTAGGSVTAKHANKARIEALGDLILANEIIHSDIKTNGMCVIKKGLIRTSEVAARKGITVKDVGSEISKPCKLTVGVDFWAKNRVAQLTKEIKNAGDHRKKLEGQLADHKKANSEFDKQINDKAREETDITARRLELNQRLAAVGKNGEAKEREKLAAAVKELDRQLEEINQVVEKLFEGQEQLAEEEDRDKNEVLEINKKIKELKKESRRIDRKPDKKKDRAAIEVLGTIYRKNIVAGAHAKLVLPEKHNQVRITEGLFADAKSSVNWSMQIKKL